MTLPRDYDDVAPECVTERLLDRPRAVELHRPRRAGWPQSLQDVPGDRARIFVPRVVVRDDHAIGETTGDIAHLRALALVAVAAAAEYTDQPAAGPHGRTHRIQHLLERVRRMRVVDDDDRIGATAEALHPAGRCRHMGKCVQRG